MHCRREFFATIHDGRRRGGAGRYQSSARPSRKKPPVGPSSGSVTPHITDAAPAATGRPPGPPLSVATQPGQIALTRIPAGRSSAARMRVSALSAALLTEYAGVPAPISASDPPPLETLT